MKVGDLVKIKHISGTGIVVSTLSGEDIYYDVYMVASQKIFFCHAKELEIVSESR